MEGTQGPLTAAADVCCDTWQLQSGSEVHESVPRSLNAEHAVKFTPRGKRMSNSVISWLLCNRQSYSSRSAVDVKAGVTTSGSSKFSIALKSFLLFEHQPAVPFEGSGRSVSKSTRSSGFSGNSNFSWFSFRSRAHSCSSQHSSRQLQQEASQLNDQPSQILATCRPHSISLQSVSDLPPSLSAVGSVGRKGQTHHSAPEHSDISKICGSALTSCYADYTASSFSAANTLGPHRCSVTDLRQHLRPSLSNDGSFDSRVTGRLRGDSQHCNPTQRQTLPGNKSGSRLSALLLNDASSMAPTRSYSSFDSNSAASPSALRQQRQMRQLRQLRLIQNITLSRGSGASGAEAGTGEYHPRTPVQRSVSSNTPSSFCIAVQPTSPSNSHSKVIARRQTFHLHPSSCLPTLPTLITSSGPHTGTIPVTHHLSVQKSNSSLISQHDVTYSPHADYSSPVMISAGDCGLTPKHKPHRGTSVELLHRYKMQEKLPHNSSHSSVGSCDNPYPCPYADSVPPPPSDLEANIHRFFERCESEISDHGVDSLSNFHPFSSSTDQAMSSDCGLPSGQQVVLTSGDGSLAAKRPNIPRSASLLNRAQFKTARSSGSTFDYSDPGSVLHTLHNGASFLAQSSALSPDTPRPHRPHAISCGADLLQQQDLQSWLQSQQLAPSLSLASGQWASVTPSPSLTACISAPAQKNLWSLGERAEITERH